MTWTREQWSRDFLAAIGNTNPTQNTLNWVVNWTDAETAGPANYAQFNLLNTTQQEPGSTFFNHLGGGIGVQNYTSYQQGIQANAKVLKNGLYPSLLSALRSNNESALGFGGAPTPGVMANLNTWCGSCGYGGVFAHQFPPGTFTSQLFSGTSTSSTSSGTSSSPTSSPLSFDVGSSLLGALGLPGPTDVAVFSQRFFLVFLGVGLVLIGLLVMFLNSPQGKQAVKTGAEVAAA